MPSLRSNVLVSTAAMILVGSLRPGFHALVNRIFGAEINGQAATLIAVIFLASLPATAALPTVTVRHVSRALGSDDRPQAHGFISLATKVLLLLLALGIGGAILHLRSAPRLDVLFVGAGIAGYGWWRLMRTLLLAVGLAKKSLLAEFLMFLSVTAALTVVLVTENAALLLGAFIIGYAVFALVTLPFVYPLLRGGRISAEDRRDFTRYNVLWFIGTASSLAARELTLLLLNDRTGAAVVGEVSVALSLLLLLAFAPRIIELPLVHELSQLGGREDRDRQRSVTDRALHWLTILTLGIAGGASILAGPILAIVGDVHTPEIATAFILIAVAFSAEMLVTPATNLIIAESEPSVLTWIGAGSLLTAVVWWISPLGAGMFGVLAGLALSYLVKALALALYARRRFAIRLVQQPVRKVTLLIFAACMVQAPLSPWLAALLFEVVLLTLFFRDLRDLVRSFTR